MNGIESRPGSYALLLFSAAAAVIRIGRLGRLRLQPGFYVYVGNACGPGGVHARLAHHMRRAERPHWHIDYLRRRATLAAVWFRYGSQSQECHWAKRFAAMPDAMAPMRGFGSSDCACETHLFFFKERPVTPDAAESWSACPMAFGAAFYTNGAKGYKKK